MDIKNLKKLSGCVLIAIGLAGCSTYGTKTAENSANNIPVTTAQSESGTSSYGLGEQGGFNGSTTAQGSSDQNLMAENTYHFAFNSSQVDAKYFAALKAHADYLDTHPDAKILIAGNTDSRGSREYNVALGMRRAQAVSTVLENYGVAKNQIRDISYGQEKPVALGHTEAAYAENRRANLTFEAR